MDYRQIETPRGFLGMHRASWIAIGLSLLLAMIALLWGVVTAVGWAFGKVPEVADAGRQATTVAIEKAGAALPGVREQMGTWWPAGTSAPVASATRDVSGTDPGPVPRYAGLVRESFAASDAGTVARYTGNADATTVIDYYLGRFQNAGYRGQVISADRDAERHQFEGPSGRVELKIEAKSGGRVEVEIRHQSIPA